MAEDDFEIKVFPRRWAVLASFCLMSLLNGVQWPQYAIVSDSVARFYGVSATAVDWASLIFMLAYAPFALPASWMLDNKGLRKTVLLAAVLNCVAAWIKVASARPDLFAVTMAGQTLASVAQPFLLHVPVRLAAVWFGAREVATACALGVLGNQMGNAVGFIVPPLIVRNGAPVEELGRQLSVVYYAVAAACTLSVLLIVLVFQDAPPVPPSRAQALVLQAAAARQQQQQAAAAAGGGNNDSASLSATTRELLRSMGRTLSAPGFALLTVAYGACVGTVCAIGTVLNQLVISVFHVESTESGIIGMLLIVAGLIGSVVCGVVLDATHKYKEVTLSVYVLALLGMLGFTASFFGSSVWVVYLTSSLLGFFLAGYLPLGFEVGVELTYPEPEGTSAGILNISAQLLGFAFTEVCSVAVDRVQPRDRAHVWVNAFLVAALAAGTLCTALLPRTLRRQAAEQSKRPDPVNPLPTAI